MIATATKPTTKNQFDGCTLIQFSSREDWLSARMSCLGASDSAAVFGEGYANQSPLTIYDSKVNRREESDEPKRFKIGRMIEPALRQIFAEETGLPVSDYGLNLFRSDNFPWLGASLDGGTIDPDFGPSPVELKNVSNFNAADWKGDEAPLKFQVQCQHQIAVTGAKRAYLLGLIGGFEPVIKVIDRDDRFIDAMLRHLENFWGYVERRELPPIDDSIATSKILGLLYPEDSGASVLLPDESDEWATDLERAKLAIKEAEAIKVAAENKIKAAIGDASFGDTPEGRRFSWKLQTVNHKAKEAYTSSFRVLRSCK